VTALAEPEVLGSVRARRRWRRILLRTSLAVLLAVVAYLGLTFVQVYRASHRDGASAAAKGEFDAIVVLGAAQYDGRPSPVLQDRLDHALALYEAELAPLIVLTGGRQEGDRFTEATAGYNYLRQQGVPDEDLLKEVDGKSTWESLAASARFLLRDGNSDVVIVTDDYHAYRAEATAEDSGLAATVSPSDSRLSSGSRTRQLLRETAAVAVGRIIGYDRLVRIDAQVEGPSG
jgi:uncharacterized SAM-binding protein YcdF (DUF218 family)